MTGKITILSILKACGSSGDLKWGMLYHSYIAENLTLPNMFLQNTLMAMYAKCGSIKDARQVFDQLHDRNTVSWTAMIAAHTKLGFAKESLKLYQQMELEGVFPNEVTFVCMLQACNEPHSLNQGHHFHARLFFTGFLHVLEVCNSLISMYMRCGRAECARAAFDHCSTHDIVTWNALLTGYAQSDREKDVFELFYRMEMEGVIADGITFLAILNACGSLANFELGKKLHAEIVRVGLDLEVEVVNSLINMYGKCGNIDSALNLFNRMRMRDIVSWSVMAAAYAQHGSAMEALEIVERMERDGFELDYIAFVSVLTACSHSGIQERGYYVLYVMERGYAVEPGEEHFACMVDLLGRAGCLLEAEVLIKKMPFTPSLSLWRALLGCCKIHGNALLARWAARRILAVEPEDTAAPLMLLNICEECSNKEDAF